MDRQCQFGLQMSCFKNSPQTENQQENGFHWYASYLPPPPFSRIFFSQQKYYLLAIVYSAILFTSRSAAMSKSEIMLLELFHTSLEVMEEAFDSLILPVFALLASFSWRLFMYYFPSQPQLWEMQNLFLHLEFKHIIFLNEAVFFFLVFGVSQLGTNTAMTAWSSVEAIKHCFSFGNLVAKGHLDCIPVRQSVWKM